MQSEFVHQEALDIFYKGLRSAKMVSQCLKNDAKTLQEAIVIITILAMENAPWFLVLNSGKSCSILRNYMSFEI